MTFRTLIDSNETRGLTRRVALVVAIALAASTFALGGTTSAQAQPPASSVNDPSAGPTAPAAVAEPAPGASIDLQVILAGPTSSSGGSAFTYTIQLTNNSLPDADGSTFSFAAPAGSTNVTATCTNATNGASCATITSTTDSAVDGALPVLPHLGTVFITVSGNYAVGTPSVTATATVAPPAGTTDPDPSTNSSDVSTALTVRVDTAVTKSVDLPTITPGDSATYTLTYSNAGPSSADGAAIYDRLSAVSAGSEFSSMHIRFLGCTTSGGAVCPTLTDSDSPTNSAVVLQTSIPTFPGNSTVTITYKVTFDRGSGCSASGNPLVYNSARVDPPRNTIETNTANQTFDLFTPANVTNCPRVDTTATKSVDLATISPGDTATYTLTFSNNESGSADGATIVDQLNRTNAGSAFNGTSVHFTGCTTTGGAVCPQLTDRVNAGNNSTVLQTVLPTFPGNSSVTITYEVTFGKAATGACSSSGRSDMYNFARIGAPANTIDTNTSNQTVDLFTPVICAEITVNKSVSPASVQAGQTVTYAVSVSNAGAASADSITFSDPLPTNFLYSSVACAPLAGSPVCPTATFDAATNTVSAVMDLAAGDGVTIVITGTAGVVQGTYANTASATPSATSVYFDPNPATDSSKVNLQIFNTTSSITVTKRIAGLPAEGLPAPETFTGSITCATQGSTQWSVTVPAGSDSASASPIQFFDGESCSIQEDTPRGTPAGYAWVGSPTITPAVIAQLGPTSPVAVTVTNTLAALPATSASLVITKNIAGSSRAGMQSDQVFSGQIVCTDPDGGVDVTQDWAVTVPAGQLSASTSRIDEPAGASCAVVESAPTTAPPGYTWRAQPEISPTSTGALSAGQIVPITVTNTLQADPSVPSGSLALTKNIAGGPTTGTTGAFGLTAFCGHDGTYAAVISITEGTTGSAVIANIPDGAQCSVQESSVTAAPAGFTWNAPEVSAQAVTIEAGSATPITVTNPLRIKEGAPSINQSGDLASTGLAIGSSVAIAVLLLAFGTWFVVGRRRRRV